MPKITIGFVLLMLTLGLAPFAFIARSRASRSPNPPIHLVMDMDDQPRYNPQASSPVFADGRAMRPHIEGTVAQEDLTVKSEMLNDNDHPRLIGADVDLKDPTTYAAVTAGRIRPTGMTDDQFAKLMPPSTDDAVATDVTFYVRHIPSQIAVTSELMHRGQERFNIYCAPCHGQSGYGDGMVPQRIDSVKEKDPAVQSGWVAPQNLHEAKIAARPDGHIFNTITNGIRTMPAYDKQISIPDRWAIVAYVRSLERSQNARSTDLTDAENKTLAQ